MDVIVVGRVAVGTPFAATLGKSGLDAITGVEGIAGLRLGRISDIPDNDRPFGSDEVAIAQDWCRRSGIPYLGRADIGHDAANKIVPFGLEARAARD